MEQNKKAISPTREENFPEWYQQVIKSADLAEHSQVRGCMVIKPWGYSIWENIQRILNEKIKETGHQNCYFPLFIPLSMMEKEAQHVEGFAKECAVVTHSRLEKNSAGKLVPVDPLEEPLIIRPTSEMIIGSSFSKWIESYRDLPLKINQWANIVRWEMRPRLFLRTVEFLWQEGHTVHSSEKEAIEEVFLMLNTYEEFMINYLAMSAVKGKKCASERFPGAVDTFSLEAIMQDRKALQACTSHYLGQNFAKSCSIRFSTADGKLEYGFTTSWGLTSRLIGALVMSHGDDDGLVLPPRIAPAQIVLIPILHKEKERVLKFCKKLSDQLKNCSFFSQPIQVIIDESDKRAVEKKWHWIKKGIPLRIEIGERDLDKNLFPVQRRDHDLKKIEWITEENLAKNIPLILEDMQKNLLQNSKKFLEENLIFINSKKELFEFFDEKSKGGFAYCHMKEKPEIEKLLKERFNVSIRAIPLDREKEKGKCIFTAEDCDERIILARSY